MTLGVGLGLRMEIGRELLERRPSEVSWLEIHPENYLRRGGRFAALLDEARERWPIVTHGLTSCFGSPQPFDREHMRELRALLERVNAPWHSDHLCFGGVDDVFLQDLLPLPFTREHAERAAARVREMRDALEREVAVEHVSTYALHPGASGLDEADFLADVLERADAKLLLDVNNVYVNAQNHGFDPEAWLARVPLDRTVQIHVAGHAVREDGLRIDTHAAAIAEPVHGLLESVLRRIGPRPVLLERDAGFAGVDPLLAEVRKLVEIVARAGTPS